jgi:anoctamin-10
VINFVLEIVVPFVSRKADSVKANVKSNGLGSKKKRVGFDGEGVGAKEEREFLENVRHQVALPEYNLFGSRIRPSHSQRHANISLSGEYAEMATQFGFVAAWSTIWPLAPGECNHVRLFMRVFNENSHGVSQ